ncbi:MAG: hypothetical protein JSV26_03150 [bacterium]|nr:MAG: hypothetical protein JSV26_03150 [bacterium]
MIESGIYVRSDVDTLAQFLTEFLPRLGFDLSVDRELPSAGSHGDRIDLTVGPWSEDWCRILVRGNDDRIRPLLEELVDSPAVLEVVYCHFEPKACQYSYHLYRGDRLVESFASGGPGLGSVSFQSELRNVPLQRILDARRFTLESIRSFGMAVVPAGDHRHGKQVEITAIPRRRSVLRRVVQALRG